MNCKDTKCKLKHNCYYSKVKNHSNYNKEINKAYDECLKACPYYTPIK